MNAMATLSPNDIARERAVIAVCAFVALCLGAVAVVASDQWATSLLIALVFFVAAMTLPLPSVALLTVALIPLQFYFPLGAAQSARGAFIFVVTAALRLLARRAIARDLWRWRAWMIPAALFVLAAFAAAYAAPDRYIALKGIYDWLPVFAAAFVIGEIVETEFLRRALVVLLIAAGVAEAMLGLAQYAAGLERVIAALQSPLSAIFFQPDLLRERLADLSFNWIVFDRALPFGTFINGIDYAIFLAAILPLSLAMLFAARDRAATIVLLACAFVIGGALLLTFKGSGVIALTGGALTLALLHIPRFSARTLALGSVALLAAILLAAPFLDAVVERAQFLIQREAGVLSATGRVAIWAQLLAFLPQRPLFGWGLNNAAHLVEPLPTLRAGAFAFNIPAAESAYVAALIETGISGFAALMIFAVVILLRAFRNARAANAPAIHIGIVAAMVALLCGNLTVAGLTTDQNGLLLGVLIGMAFAKWKRV
jgi:O-antigen ligase